MPLVASVSAGLAGIVHAVSAVSRKTLGKAISNWRLSLIEGAMVTLLVRAAMRSPWLAIAMVSLLAIGALILAIAVLSRGFSRPLELARLLAKLIGDRATPAEAHVIGTAAPIELADTPAVDEPVPQVDFDNGWLQESQELEPAD